MIVVQGVRTVGLLHSGMVQCVCVCVSGGGGERSSSFRKTASLTFLLVTEAEMEIGPNLPSQYLPRFPAAGRLFGPACRDTTDFRVLLLYPFTLPNKFIRSSSLRVCVYCLGFLYIRSCYLQNQVNFSASFLIWMPLIVF